MAKKKLSLPYLPLQKPQSLLSLVYKLHSIIDRTFRTFRQTCLAICLFICACLCHFLCLRLRLCLSSCFERKIIYELRSITDRPYSPSRPFALSSLSHYTNYLPGRQNLGNFLIQVLEKSQELQMPDCEITFNVTNCISVNGENCQLQAERDQQDQASRPTRPTASGTRPTRSDF